MRTVNELTQDELEELRWNYFYQLLDGDEEVLGDIDELSKIPLENIIAHYEGIYFVEEDFSCNL